MAVYSINGAQAVASPDESTLSITAEAATKARRGRVIEFTIGSSATPADNALLHTVDRCTTSGSGTSVTPAPTDTADAAADAIVLSNLTAEPTYSSTIQHQVALNQRATYRWVATQYGEIIWPATDENGVGWYTTHASFNGSVEVHVLFEEL